MPELTIRGAAEAQISSAEDVPSNLDHGPGNDEEPRASTSAVTLEAVNGKEPSSTSNGAPAQVRPPKPWGLAEYGIPPPPADLQPDPAVEAKLRHFHTLRAQGVFFNDSLQSNKSFRNPSILSKLVDFVNVDEKLSAMPPDVWSSSHGVAPQAWAASIAELQKQDSEERERAQQRGKRNAIDFASSASSSSRPKERIRMADAGTSMSSSTSRPREKDERKSSRWDKGDSSRRSEDRRHGDRHSHASGRSHRTRSRSPASRRY
ncbi:hypothetical protein P389DRAFT_36676 [Cystobasidium minutum MCA 4210]|uniref:uncharacterized protein n=1 Tax=Cystobasidium minutum MCA 4210 TaxID=1397322 RepID=UPI0034CF92B7|eukprot:jgi/Rhomi1/36676/CE36675_768